MKPLTEQRKLRWSMLAAAGLTTAAAVEQSSAFCVYNCTRYRLHLVEQPAYGDFDVFIDPYRCDFPNGQCCHHSNGDCNPDPDDPDEILVMEVSTSSADHPNEDFFALISLPANGWVSVIEQDRTHIHPSLPPHLYLRSFTAAGNLYSTASTFGGHYDDASRDVRFLVAADCQYWDDQAESSAYKTNPDQVHATMRSMLGGEVRGILYAGDLTQDSSSTEWDWYVTSIGGQSRWFFDGLGNHDDFDDLGDDIVNRKRTTIKTRKGNDAEPHYSWDWHDVHFVQLNLFPGNSTAPDFPDEDPRNSLTFLVNDLAAHVGASGRPVVLVHHYGFDPFSINDYTQTCDDNGDAEEWWTASQRLAYWNAVAPYNVVAIFTGHVHLIDVYYDPNSPSGGCYWRYDWDRPDGASGGPASIPSFVAASARNSVFLDVRLQSPNQILVIRKDKFGSELDRECVFGGAIVVDASAPGPGDGSPSFPFPSILAALDAVENFVALCGQGPPDRIDIRSGAYSGGVTLDLDLAFPHSVELRSSGGTVVIGG